MRCFSCGKEIPERSAFCPYCGKEQVRIQFCLHCGAQLGEDSAFCAKCGKPVGEEGKEIPYNPTGEEKNVHTDTAEAPQKKKLERPLVIALWSLGILTVLLLAIVGWLLATHSTASEPEEIVLTPKMAAEQVLYLEVYDHLDNSIATGSGFLVDDSMKLATNYHVIAGGHHIEVYDSENHCLAEITHALAYDETADIALLEMTEIVDVLPLPLADSSQVRQGDKIYAIGYPLGLNNTLSDGIVSSVFVEEGVDTLQITAPVSSGSSGGALLNEDCGVIGIVFASNTRGQNMNFAIASNELAEMLAKKKEAIPLEELYLLTHPQLAFEDYKAEIQCLWVPDYDYADLIWEEWYDLDGSLFEVLELLQSCDGIGEADYYENTQIIAPGEWSEAFDEWCFDPCRRLGDIEIFGDDDGYTICCYVNAIGEKTAEKAAEEDCDHQYSWTTTKKATCTENGSKTGTCKNCAHTVKEEIQALGHQEVVDAAETAATCTKEGHGKTSHCSRCEEVLSAGETYPKLEHDYQKGKCTMCGESNPNAIITTEDLQGTWRREWYFNGHNGYREFTFAGNKYTFKSASAAETPYADTAEGTFSVEGNMIYFYPSSYTANGEVVADAYYGQNHDEEVWDFTGDTVLIAPGEPFYKAE